MLTDRAGPSTQPLNVPTPTPISREKVLGTCCAQTQTSQIFLLGKNLVSGESEG